MRVGQVKKWDKWTIMECRVNAWTKYFWGKCMY